MKNRVLILKRVLPSAILLLVALHITVAVLDHYIDSSTLSYIRSLFDLDSEANVPTIFSTGMLAMVSYLLWQRTKKRLKPLSKLVYQGLSFMFGFLAFDEFFSLHERMAQPVRDLFDITQDNLFYHAWVIPAGIVVASLAIVSWFLLRDKSPDSKFQRKIIILFMIGACGVFLLEVAGTQLLFDSLISYSLGPVLAEELLELTVVALILYKTAKDSQRTIKG